VQHVGDARAKAEGPHGGAQLDRPDLADHLGASSVCSLLQFDRRAMGIVRPSRNIKALGLFLSELRNSRKFVDHFLSVNLLLQFIDLTLIFV
jgi:hypothetical protein